MGCFKSDAQRKAIMTKMRQTKKTSSEEVNDLFKRYGKNRQDFVEHMNQHGFQRDEAVRFHDFKYLQKYKKLAP